MRRSSLWSRPWAQPLVACLLFVATVALRVPYASRMLYSWDSANFALALSQYNVTFHQPHPPGYPLYVGIAKLLDLLVHDANASYVWISILTSAAAVAVLFLLASRMYDPWIGLAAASLLSVSVGFWGYGEVAYPYTSLAFFGTLMAWLCYLMWRGHGSVGVLSGLVLGIASGVRQDLLVFLSPLWWVAGVWRIGLLRLVASMLVLGLTVAAWLIPAVQLSGGWPDYQQVSSAQSNYVVGTYSVLARGATAARANVTTLLLYLQQTFGLSLLVAIYFMGRFLTFRALVADHRLLFLLLWFLPAALVYVLVHIGDPGYTLTLLPVLAIVTAVGIRDIDHDLRSGLLLLSTRHRLLGGLAKAAGNVGTTVAVLLVIGLMASNTSSFLGSAGPARLTEIRTIDQILAKQVEYVKQFQPESVVVVGKARMRQLQYYLPGYNVRLLYDEYRTDYTEMRNRYPIPDGVSTVLVTDLGKEPVQLSNVSGAEVTLADSPGPRVSLWKFEVKPGDTIEYGYDYFGVGD